MYTLYIVRIIYETEDTGYFESAGTDEVLAVYADGAELSELQHDGKQQYQEHKVRKFTGFVRNSGLYAERPFRRIL